MGDQAKRDAMKFLTSRMHSEFEVRQHLIKKGHEAALIDEAVDYLYQYRYLDDLKYSEAFIHDRIRFNPCGRSKLYYDLKQKGVDTLTAEEALSRYYSVEEELSLAEKLWQKKAQQKPGIEVEKIKRYLASKGFSYEIIERATDKNMEYLNELS